MTLEDVIRETQQTRRLLELHLEHEREEARARKLREEAMMEMLKDILSKLP